MFGKKVEWYAVVCRKRKEQERRRRCQTSSLKADQRHQTSILNNSTGLTKCFEIIILSISFVLAF